MNGPIDPAQPVPGDPLRPGAPAPAHLPAPPHAAPHPAPTLPPPGTAGAPPRPGTKLKPAVVVGAIVGVVALLGIVGAVVGGGDDAASARSSTPTVPLGSAVLDPSAGPQPAEPAVTTPVPGPGTEPVVTAPTTTAVPPTPVPAPVSGSQVEVGDDVAVTPAPGWSVEKQEGGFVQLARDAGGAKLFVSLYDSTLGSSVPEASGNYLSSSIQPFVAELETSEVAEAGALSADVVSNGSFEYRGIIASQGGNAPVEGFVVIFVRADGTVVVYEEVNEQGAYETFADDYAAMLNSIVPTL